MSVKPKCGVVFELLLVSGTLYVHTIYNSEELLHSLKNAIHQKTQSGYPPNREIEEIKPRGTKAPNKVLNKVKKVLVIQSYLTLCDPMDCSPPVSSLSMKIQGKNTRVGCHCLLQGIFLTHGLNPGFLHCRQILYLVCEAQYGPKDIMRADIQFYTTAHHFSRIWYQSNAW